MAGSEQCILWGMMAEMPGTTLLRNLWGWFGRAMTLLKGLRGIAHRLTQQQQTEQQLLQLVKAVETMQLGVTITDLNGKILYTNPAEAEIHGYTVEELIGSDLGIFAPAELRNPMPPEQFKFIRGLRESVNIRKDGTTFPVRLMSDVVKDAQGTPVALVTSCEDITDYKRSEQTLQRHARELALLNEMSDALQSCQHEAETYLVIVEVCQQLFPTDSGCLCLSHPDDDTLEVVDFWGEPPASAATMPSRSASQKDFEQQTHCREIGVVCPHRMSCPSQECLSTPIVASGEFLGLFSLCVVAPGSQEIGDMTEGRITSKHAILDRIAEHYALSLANLRLREKLKIEAIRDPLTGLYNRRYMKDALEREAYRAERHHGSVGIIMLDLDHFKHFNDSYGHKAGDLVLQELGTFLMTHIRGEDIACRYGGEEFLLILPDSSLKSTVQRAEQLRHGIKQLHISFQGQVFHLSASFGVAAMPRHSRDIMHTVHLSDSALYHAKTGGRDRVFAAQDEVPGSLSVTPSAQRMKPAYKESIMHAPTPA